MIPSGPSACLTLILREAAPASLLIEEVEEVWEGIAEATTGAVSTSLWPESSWRVQALQLSPVKAGKAAET